MLSVDWYVISTGHGNLTVSDGELELGGYDPVAEEAACRLSGERVPLLAVAAQVLRRLLGELSTDTERHELLARLERGERDLRWEAIRLGEAVALDGSLEPPIELLRWLMEVDPSATPRVAQYPGAPAELLYELASVRGLRSHVASNPGAPAALLEELALDPAEVVVEEVAENRATPRPLLERLLAEAPPLRLQYLANNQALDAEMLRRLEERVESLLEGDLSSRGIDAWHAQHLAPQTRRAMLLHSALPEDLLLRIKDKGGLAGMEAEALLLKRARAL